MTRISHRPRLLAAVLGTLALLAGGLATAPGASSDTAQSSISVPAEPGHTNTVQWTGTAPFYNEQQGGLDPVLDGCNPSDHTYNTQHTVQVSFPSGLGAAVDTLVRFSIAWQDTVGDNFTNDLALYVYGPDHKLVAVSDGSQASEGINVTDRVSGIYTVLVCSFQNLPTGTPFTATVTATTSAPPTFPAATGVTPPTYRQYSAPPGKADAGEPSIGNNWKSGATLYTAGLGLYKVDFDDAKGTSAWTRVNDDLVDLANKVSFDPIGWTDHTTGRTIISQLTQVCSGAAFSDDDFQTQSLPSEGCGTGLNGADHQTVGGGPYPQGAVAVPVGYPHAVYYCSQGQAIVFGGAYCARSDNGGAVFGPPVQIWSTECSGIHGHVQVAPDGTVYVPNTNCGDKQGVAVSTDAGLTWKVHTIPDSIAGDTDPMVGIGTDNTVYFSYADGSGHPRVTISTDHGSTWTKSADLGAAFGIRNTEFAMNVAGDGDRDAVAFLGTTTPGSQQAASFGKSADGDTYTGGEWHLYVATTYDRGRTWTAVDTTPNDPVQRGCMWNSGGSNPCRNLLDFDDITIDKTGRVMVGLADGCVPPSISTAKGNNCVADRAVSANGLTRHGSIMRQLTGKTLFKAYDGQASLGPAAPPVPKPHAHGGAGKGGNLAATGLTAWLAAVGALLLTGSGWALRRRRRAQ